MLEFAPVPNWNDISRCLIDIGSKAVAHPARNGIKVDAESDLDLRLR